MDLPSAGLNQIPSGSTCTHKKTTHTKDIHELWPLLASASESSAVYVFKQVILMEKNKSSPKDQENLQLWPLLEIRQAAEYQLKHLWSFNPLSHHNTYAPSILCLLPASHAGTGRGCLAFKVPSSSVL